MPTEATGATRSCVVRLASARMAPVLGDADLDLHPAGAAEKRSAPLPRWFTPLRLLAIFCTTNLFVYIDRGLIASNGVQGSPPSETQPEGTGIQGAFNLTYFQDGLLPAAFMVGLLISSPIFAEASKTGNPFRLLAIGMGVWTLACLGCAAAPNFPLLLISRALVGVGEASFVSLAAPFIDDYAPPKSKSKWFAFFYLCIPVGFALGYILGGLVAASMSWRWAFVIEAAAMVPFVMFTATSQPLLLKGSEDVEPEPKGTFAALRMFWQDTQRVLRLRVWLLVDCAYVLYVAVLGVYGFWGPQAGKQLFFGPEDDGAGKTDLAFGGVTVITGVVGTITGGVLLDRMGATLRNASLLCAASNLLGVGVIIAAFSATTTFSSFLGVFGLGQLLLFCTQAPIAALGMWTVPHSLRSLGVSLMTISIHLFGDVPSPPLLGLLQSKLAEGKSPEEAAQQWRLSMSLISLLLLGSGLLFSCAAYHSTPAADFRLPDAGTPRGAGRGGERARGGSNGGEECKVLLDKESVLSDEEVGLGSEERKQNGLVS